MSNILLGILALDVLIEWLLFLLMPLTAVLTVPYWHRIEEALTQFPGIDRSLLDLPILALIRLFAMPLCGFLYGQNSGWKWRRSWAWIGYGIPLACLVYTGPVKWVLIDTRNTYAQLKLDPFVVNLQLGIACVFNLLGLIFYHRDLTTRFPHDSEDYQPLTDADSTTEQKSATGNSLRKRTVKWLFKLLLVDAWLFGVALISLIVASVAQSLTPRLFGFILDAMNSNEPMKTAEWIGVLVLIFVIGSFFSWIRGWVFGLCSQRVVKRLRILIFRSAIYRKMEFFDQHTNGEFSSRLAADTQVVQNTVNISMSMMLRMGVSIVSSVLLLILISWKLTLMLFCTTPIIVIGTYFYGQFMGKLQKQFQDKLALATSNADESIRNVRLVRSFAQEPWVVGRFETSITETFNVGKLLAWWYGISNAVVQLTGQMAIVLTVWYGDILVKRGEITIGDLTSFLVSTLMVSAYVVYLSTVYADLSMAIGASERVYEIVHGERESRRGSAVMSDKDYGGELELRNVSFNYPFRPEVQVLQGVSFTIQPGQFVALVGPSGSGKSTIFSLLERFYELKPGDPGKIIPNTGIFLNGRNISDLDLTAYRRHIGYVSQNPILFNTTIRENIAFGLLHLDLDQMAIEIGQDDGDEEEASDHTGDVHFDSSDTDCLLDYQQPKFQKSKASLESISPHQLTQLITDAAKQANAHDFIVSLPDGYETIVGDSGAQLSGGQKQRIAIARALITNPRILLLDEATSALDSESEGIIKQTVEQIRNDRTIICIAHRLSTVKNADQVIVVCQGKVAEMGTHTQLMSNPTSLYHRLAKDQLL